MGGSPRSRAWLRQVGFVRIVMRRDLSTLLDQYRPPFGARIGIATPIRIATRIPITDARLRRYKRIGAVAGARKDLPKTHKSRSRQETSPRRPRTTASDGRAASRALGRPAWRGDGGHFSSLESIPSLSPSFARRRLESHRVDGNPNPKSKSARRMQHRCVLGPERAELETNSANRRA